MSIEVIAWALNQPIKHSTAKFVLVALANCANGLEFIAWPSIAYLSSATGQDRKTVLLNIKRLIDMGYLTDTGERKGATKQVIVYRILQPENDNSAENGLVKTVPFFRGNSTVFPHKEYRFSVETVPKTGHGTGREPERNRKGTKYLSETSDPIPANTKNPPTPHKEIIELYNTILGSKGLVRVNPDLWAGSAREKHLKARWSGSKDRQTLKFWRQWFEYVAGIGFLTGSNAKGWRADLGWLLKSENFIKVTEGKYE